jgi:hypothetical protein
MGKGGNMESLIGILGVVFGIIMGELIRMINRVEDYNAQLVIKRIDICNNLYNLMSNSWYEMYMMLENEKQFDEGEIHNCVLNICEFCDENSFYISEELRMQCCLLFMGIHETNEERREVKSKELQGEVVKTKEMIINESGISEINKKAQKIFKYNHKSEYIEQYKKIKRAYEERSA